ncbi:MAG: hypothetical protein ABI184_08110 [Ginsengibacter sp.]
MKKAQMQEPGAPGHGTNMPHDLVSCVEPKFFLDLLTVNIIAIWLLKFCWIKVCDAICLK